MDKLVLKEIIGYVAAVLTTSAYLPQALKTIRTRKTEDISLFMYLLMFSGIIGWFAYGIVDRSMPIILANAVTITLVSIILVMKIRFK